MAPSREMAVETSIEEFSQVTVDLTLVLAVSAFRSLAVASQGERRMAAARAAVEPKSMLGRSNLREYSCNTSSIQQR